MCVRRFGHRSTAAAATAAAEAMMKTANAESVIDMRGHVYG